MGTNMDHGGERWKEEGEKEGLNYERRRSGRRYVGKGPAESEYFMEKSKAICLLLERCQAISIKCSIGTILANRIKESLRGVVTTPPPSPFRRFSTKSAVVDRCGLLLRCSRARVIPVLHGHSGTS